MKAITILQPWAGLLVLGIKKCETRSWNTKHRGELAVHSSGRWTHEGKELLQALMDSNPAQFFKGSEYYKTCTDLGSVLGKVTVEETCSTNNSKPLSLMERIFGNYEPNRFYWKCINPVLFPAPVYAIGKLSIWNWEPLNGQI